MSAELLRSGFKGEKMVVVPRRLMSKFTNHELIKSLFLTDIGFFPKASRHFRERANGCSEYILIYCIEGQGSVITVDETHVISPNSFFIIKKEQKHIYYADNRDPWSIYWVHFTGLHAPYLYNKFVAQNNGKPIFIPFNQNKIAEFEYILELLKLGYTDQIFEYSSMLLHKLIGSFIYYALKSKKTLDIAKEDLVKGITEYLNDNIYNSITLQQVERKFNRSVSSLCSIFKEKTGYSIMHFFSLIKIQKACELMNLTNLSIKEISYELNYQDPLYFSRVFKKFMGVPPKEYRNKY